MELLYNVNHYPMGVFMKNAYWSRKEKKMKQSFNLVGKKFGKLIVVNRTEDTHKQWDCVCDCGNKKRVSTGDLTRKKGGVRSCGCANRMFLDGKVFGRLTVLKYAGKRKQNEWECVCSCGNKIIVPIGRLRNGKTKSCGCLRKEMCRERTLKNKLEKGEAHKNMLYHRYKKDAERRSLVFNLTLKQFETITKKNCYYCGLAPTERQSSQVSKGFLNGAYVGNGIDRINNELGYIKGNCAPCCRQCNCGKFQGTKEEFIEWVFRVAKYQSELG